MFIHFNIFLIFMNCTFCIYKECVLSVNFEITEKDVSRT
nr:unnamed protein product [Callosobruchus chinensis]